MILFETENSVYRVAVSGNEFIVKKIKEKNPRSQFIQLHGARRASQCYIKVGERADFGDWHTSVVVRLLEEDECASYLVA